jgi:hypothetical protein
MINVSDLAAIGRDAGIAKPAFAFGQGFSNGLLQKHVTLDHARGEKIIAIGSPVGAADIVC